MLAIQADKILKIIKYLPVTQLLLLLLDLSWILLTVFIVYKAKISLLLVSQTAVVFRTTTTTTKV